MRCAGSGDDPFRLPLEERLHPGTAGYGGRLAEAGIKIYVTPAAQEWDGRSPI